MENPQRIPLRIAIAGLAVGFVAACDDGLDLDALLAATEQKWLRLALDKANGNKSFRIPWQGQS